MSGGRLALLADCLLLGLLTAICAVPVVTAYPAMVAACTILRDERSPGRFFARLGEILRSGLSVWLVPPLAVLVLALDAFAISLGVPGSGPLTVLLIAAGLTGGVLALRCATRWHAGQKWSRTVRDAARDLTRDPAGSLLLAFAIVAALAIAILVPLTGLVLGGLLALAAVAVANRSATVTVANRSAAVARRSAAVAERSAAVAGRPQGTPAVDPHPVGIAHPGVWGCTRDADQPATRRREGTGPSRGEVRRP